MYDQLSEIAPTVMIQLEALNWKEDIRTLAQVFGREDAADQWISAYEEKAKEAGEAVRLCVWRGYQLSVIFSKRWTVLCIHRCRIWKCAL